MSAYLRKIYFEQRIDDKISKIESIELFVWMLGYNIVNKNLTIKELEIKFRYWD